MTRRTFLAAPSLMVSNTGPRWLLADLQGNLQSESWPDSQKAVSMGSLMKPFLTLAYLETHRSLPQLTCHGSISGCWLARGHGQQEIVDALANSCNAYFLQLTAEINRPALDRICLSVDLLPPARDWPPFRLIGLHEGWPQVPRRVLSAFASFHKTPLFSGVQIVLAGMQRCASAGTARELGFPCYAKTGTGACCHYPSANGDGYVAVLYPLNSPRRMVLLQRHNTTGAQAAAVVKPLLQRID